MRYLNDAGSNLKVYYVFPAEVEALGLILEDVAVAVLTVFVLRERHDSPRSYIRRHLVQHRKKSVSLAIIVQSLRFKDLK